MADTERKLRVFLCHAKEDKPTVRELYRQLTAEGWMDVWLDEEKLFPGQDWNLEIEKAVDAADAIIVCFSNNSITKEGYVQREIRIVLDLADYKPEGTLFIFPVRLEDCEPPRRLRQWQYADYFPKEERERAFQRLLISLRMRAERTGLQITKSVKQHDSEKAVRKKFVTHEQGKRRTVNHQTKAAIDRAEDKPKSKKQVDDKPRPPKNPLEVKRESSLPDETETRVGIEKSQHGNTPVLMNTGKTLSKKVRFNWAAFGGGLVLAGLGIWNFVVLFRDYESIGIGEIVGLIFLGLSCSISGIFTSIACIIEVRDQ